MLRYVTSTQHVFTAVRSSLLPFFRFLTQSSQRPLLICSFSLPTYLSDRMDSTREGTGSFTLLLALGLSK